MNIVVVNFEFGIHESNHVGGYRFAKLWCLCVGMCIYLLEKHSLKFMGIGDAFDIRFVEIHFVDRTFRRN